MRREEKAKVMERVISDIKSHKYSYFCDFYRLPANVFQAIRRDLAGRAKIYVTRKKLVELSLRKAGLNRVAEKLPSNVALLFSEIPPGEMWRILKNREVELYVKPGEVAQEDIVIPEGPTELSPGKAREIRALGIETAIVKGKLTVKKAATVVKKGEKVSRVIAGLLRALDIKPVKAWLRISVAMDNKGIIYTPEVMSLTLDDIKQRITDAFERAFRVSYNIKAINKYTLPIMLSEASVKGKMLGINVGFLAKEILPDLICLAHTKAATLKSIVEGQAG
ncbi:MAG: 50S ribosomal protein L10 [Thermoproteota archaeon]|nr:MAG: 50S ribosomal protein L10 [Candidatus Korarchaeota archaeon]HDN02012.1 50S ribosomal protein L10 [Candidatus Bathyarchaeota archaeon]